MTLIIANDHMMVADGVSTAGGVRVAWGDPKITRARDRSLVGSCGRASDCYAFSLWAQEGMDFSAPPKLADPEGFRAIWLKPDGTIWFIDEDFRPYPCGGKFAIIGERTGAEIARGALMAGALPVKAARIACRVSVWLSEPLQVEFLASDGDEHE